MKNSAAKIVAAFLAGAVAGAALGLILAPDKGSETRKKIKSKVDELGEKAKDLYNQVKNPENTEEEQTQQG